MGGGELEQCRTLGLRQYLHAQEIFKHRIEATPKATRGNLQAKRIDADVGLCSDGKGWRKRDRGWSGRTDRPQLSGGLGGAAIQGIGHASKGCQAEGACGGQKDERLEGQQGKPDR